MKEITENNYFIKRSNETINALERCVAYERMIKRAYHRLNDIIHDLDKLNFDTISYISKDDLLKKKKITKTVISRLELRQLELLTLMK